MSDFLSKIENFLFDILGLVLPGLIFLSILFFPILFIDISKIPSKEIEDSYILSGLITLTTILKNGLTANSNLMIAVGIILSYLIGHFIKVFSIIKYEFMVAIFDKGINKFVLLIYEAFKDSLNCLIKKIGKKDMYKMKFYIFLKNCFYPIKNTISKIFTFKSPDYFSNNEQMRTDCINIINNRLNATYPDKWYSLYKISTIVNSQENIKSLSSFFLAKYNLYRSLSFIFAFTIIYYNFFFRAITKSIPHELDKISTLILIFTALLWFTFHYKFKRYWTLCGNETLVSLYYYLNKKKFNES